MRRAPTFAAVLALAGATAGCSTDGSASAPEDPIATVTPSVTVTPSPTPVEDQHTLKGSEAFVRRYIAETNRAYATGDVRWLKERSAKSCGTCANVIDTVVQAYGVGGRIVGADQHVYAVQSLTAALQSPQRVVVSLSSGVSLVLDRKGKTQERLPAEPQSPFIITLHWSMDRWSVSAIQRSV